MLKRLKRINKGKQEDILDQANIDLLAEMCNAKNSKKQRPRRMRTRGYKKRKNEEKLFFGLKNLEDDDDEDVLSIDSKNQKEKKKLELFDNDSEEDKEAINEHF